jgi:hypothetical protein
MCTSLKYTTTHLFAHMDETYLKAVENLRLTIYKIAKYFQLNKHPFTQVIIRS